MITVRLVTRAGEVLVRVPVNTTLLGAVMKAGVPIGQSCRGEGVCGACEVTMLAGRLTEPDAIEAKFLGARGAEKRFACRARVLDDCTITTTYW